MKVTAREECSVVTLCKAYIPNVRTLVPEKDPTNDISETFRTNHMLHYILFGVGASLLLVITMLSGIFCLRKRRSLALMETIDENPDYGEGEEYYGGRSQVMDQNDYYYNDM